MTTEWLLSDQREIRSTNDCRLRVPLSEHLLTGGRLLRRAFLEQPYRSIGRDGAIFTAEGDEPPVILIQRGIAYRSSTLPDRRRAILDLLLPGDFGGIDHLFLGFSNQELTPASALGYRAMT